METQLPSAAILQQVAQQIHDGHYQAALDCGFDWDEIRLLESLSLQDFHWLKTLSPHFIECEVRVNHAQTRLALRRLTDYQHTQACQQRLLTAGAPRHLMDQLYGWTPQHYRSQRKLLRLDGQHPHGGRPANPTLNEEEAILSQWECFAERELPERYLQTALAVQVSVRQVCRALSLRDEREREALGINPVMRATTGMPDRSPRPPPTRSAGVIAPSATDDVPFSHP